MNPRRLSLCVLGALLGSSASAGSALADCTVDSSNTLVCTGETGPIVWANEYTGLSVSELPGNASGPFSIVWAGSDGQGNGQPGNSGELVTLSFDGQPFGITSIETAENTPAFALQALSEGGDGSSGDHDTKFAGDAESDPGGQGGSTGGASVTFSSGSIAITEFDFTSGVTLIGASSIAGDAGRSNEAKSETGGSARGGVGGVGGEAGQASITVLSGSFSLALDDPLVFEPSYILFATSLGGAGGDGGEAEAGNGNSHGGAGNTGGTAGSVSISVSDATMTFGAASSGGEVAGVAIFAESAGGEGGVGGEARSVDFGAASGGAGGAGGGGDFVEVTLQGTVVIDTQDGASALWASSQGGQGGDGGEGHSGAGGNSHGGDGGDGGSAGNIDLALGTAAIAVSGGGSGVVVQSLGGAGGTGGHAQTDGAAQEADGGTGGTGGDGGNIFVAAGSGPATIQMQSTTTTQHAILLQSLAGAGGDGGSAHATAGSSQGGDGGAGGTGGTIDATIWANITTAGPQSQGIFARSYGGAGGDGGDADSIAGKGHGGAGAGSGPGGAVTVDYQGILTTTGSEANGILAQSVGGFAGSGGSATGFEAFGAGSESAGDGGEVSVSLAAGSRIETSGDYAYGLQAQSIGGGGGRGGSGDGIAGLGGSGSAGGNGQTVTVGIAAGATVETSGLHALAVQAASIGGGGGDGGASLGVVSLGGSGGTGGNGGDVKATNDGTLNTQGDRATGLMAISVGGGGGSAHSTAGLAAVGGSGAQGGTGGDITLANSGTLATHGADADAVFGQSIGGGGGHGSNALSVSGTFSMAIGGQGGSGNDGGVVSYSDTGAAGRTISTTGDRSRGVFLQSVGGGGGNGGNAISTGGFTPFQVSLAFGGGGGAGGDGSLVQYLDGVANVSTAGDHAAAIQAQSVGGGGGNAGTTVATGQAGFSVDLALGGDGGSGGAGGQVEVESNGLLSTVGHHSVGVLAQSLGGGGGNAGTTIAASAVSPISVQNTIGGAGGTGGSGGEVTVTGGGGVQTTGHNAAALQAQSIGGGGGSGGTTVSGTGVALAAVDVAVGGHGGTGGTSGKVTITWADGITTGGDNATGVLAQSIGGGGGSAGTTVAGDIGSQGSVQTAVGGSGGGGGGAADVAVTLTGQVTTGGDVSDGVLAQSIGGGGGHSGTTVAGTWSSGATLNLAVGGSGGDGGDGQGVQVTVAGVSTTGDSSSAVTALSVGGGGGSSHFAGGFSGVSNEAVNISVGGSGGRAGDGGTVGVTTNGSLGTKGHNAPGIKAQSIGGGGGDSGVTATGSLSGSTPIGVSVGGDGGGSGSGGSVTVSTAAGTTISTEGDLSEGILAASIARSGGSAGHVVDATAFAGADADVGVGGTGGSGGNGGTVDVTNLADISTQGVLSGAIEARSLGGGGGSAKGSINASALSMGNLNLTVGGAGGNGGNGGNVTVESHGALSTASAFSFGILAQSAGGAGGHGGYAAQANATGGEVSGELGLSIGGGGGNGGQGGTVSVTASNQIATGDFGAIGILAQSLGGSGGAGGNVYSGTLSGSSDFSLAANMEIGGSGGSGTFGGQTTVTNAAAITTDGYYADGILAQSIGGNGGRGGSVYSVLATVQPGSALNLGVDVGGSGGTGADGNVVLVNNTGAITTSKGGSDGIAAMSIGGGGGKGGSAANLNLNPVPSGSGSGDSVTGTLNVGIGGSGGAAGFAGPVTVVNFGAINTHDDSSRGIYAISVGGGGGDGGTTSSASFSFNGLCSALSGGAGYGCKASQDTPENETTNVSVSLTAEIGGSAGAGGAGGDIGVSNQGAILTSGRLSHGIVAHSVGGGGGNGGSGALGISAWTNNATADWAAKLPGTFTFIPNLNNVSMAVGGSGGAAGNGGNVIVDSSGTIATQGDHAFAVHAQSVGGGGGNGGAGATGLWSAVTVGGRGSGGGDGGNVTVSLVAGIQTGGKGGVGVFAQSVGGGGGTAGDVELGWTAPWANLNIGAGVGVQESAGGGGDGGQISVTTAAITTTGENAHGVLAQSVGGSGGIASISGEAGASLLGTFAGSSGDAGDGGAVSVTNNGAINVSGTGAHGIVAQSVAGRLGHGDVAGNVTIEVNADVIASGTNGRAILAQSQGDGSGAIAITVAAGATVSTAVDGAETIGLFDGLGNTLLNNGTIRHAGNTSVDYVIRTNGSALAVQNNGIIEGSVLSQFSDANQSPGNAIAFTNATGGTFGLGERVDLGSGGTLSNAGTISAGTDGTIGQALLQGALVQSAGATLAVDFDFAGESDIITISDDSPLPQLAGVVRPLSQGSLPSSGTSGSVPILFALGGIATNSLSVANSGAVDYSLLQQPLGGGGSEQIVLSYHVDYAPWAGGSTAKVSDDAWGRITGNHTRFGRHLDDLVLYRQGAPGDDLAFVDDLVHSALGTGSVDELLDLYDGFVPTEIFAVGESTLFSSLRFADALLSCPALGSDGYMLFDREGSCGWVRLAGTASHRDGSGDSFGYDATEIGVLGGLQLEVADGWFAGLALGYEWVDLSADDLSGDGGRFHAGVTLKREFGATTLSASLAGGFGQIDLDRRTTTPEGPATAESEVSMSWIGGHARVAHAFDLSEASYLKPWLDVGIEHYSQGAYEETGAGDFGLQVGAVSNTFATVSPMLEFGTAFAAGGTRMEATFNAGMLAILGDTTWSSELQLYGVGGDGPSYTLSDDAGGVFAQVGAGLKAQLGERMALEAGAGALLNGAQQVYSGMAKLVISF